MDTYQTELKPVRVHARCEVCKEGELILDKRVRTSHPAQYRHECDKCHAEKWFLGQTFPYIQYIEIPEISEVKQEPNNEHNEENCWRLFIA